VNTWWVLLFAAVVAIWLAAGLGIVIGTMMAGIVERRP
jgi:hypothetical protein